MLAAAATLGTVVLLGVLCVVVLAGGRAVPGALAVDRRNLS